MSTIKLTIYAKPVRQTVGEQGSTATCDTTRITL